MNKPDIPPHYFIQRKAKKLIKEGRDIILLSVGDPDINTDKRIIDAMYKAALDGHTHYGNIRGIPELRESIADTLNNELNISITSENIILLPGSKTSIFLLTTALLNKDSKIIVMTPTWGVYLYLLDRFHYKYKKLKLKFENNWRPSQEDIEFLKKEDFDSIIIINPSNPTGKVLPKEDIEAVTDIAREKDAYIFADEIYYNLIYDDKPFYSFLNTGYEKAVGIYSFSKAYAMTGFRIGWIVANQEIINQLSKVMTLLFTNVPDFIQYAALKALSLKDIVEKNREIFKNRTRMMESGLMQLGFKFHRVEGAFYIFIKTPENYRDSFQFANDLLDKAGVAVAPGTAFGDYPNYFRVVTSVSEDKIDRAINRISSYLNK